MSLYPTGSVLVASQKTTDNQATVSMQKVNNPQSYQAPTVMMQYRDILDIIWKKVQELTSWRLELNHGWNKEVGTL